MEAKKDNSAITILISGASIAGLTTAYWLIKYGFEVTIVERAPHLRLGGQAVDVRGPALDVAEEMGIINQLRENSTKLKGMSIIDVDTNQETYRSTERTFTGGKLDSPDIEILRDDLCTILFKAVGNQAKYIFDDSISSLEQDSAGVKVAFAKSNPMYYNLVIGADGLRSNVRRLAFGNDEKFVHYLGHYVATFNMPNILNLDHWEVFFHHQGVPIAVCIVKEKEGEARTYLGFGSPTPIEYDYKDIQSQKELIIEKYSNIGGEIPNIIECMKNSSTFYFDSNNQVVMDNWSEGSVALVGDAAYSVSPASGQGTSIAMVGAYVLAGELAANKHDLTIGLTNYNHNLQEYIKTNQKLAYDLATATSETRDSNDNDIPDFGLSIVPFQIKKYL